MRLDIDHIARLAQLELTPDERERFGSQLEAIVGYCASLDAYATDGVEPTLHPIPHATPLRADAVGAHLSHEAATANAPATDEDAFVVPRVV